ncbi:MAG: hypothetical protein AAGG48_14210 [Planctomycetota bacterium]
MDEVRAGPAIVLILNSFLSEQLPTVIYSPESPLSNPGKLIREVFSDIFRYRELVGILFMRDLKAQFRQSYLGYLWLVAPPLMTTGVWLFLNRSQVVTVTDAGMPYALFVMIGSIFWQSFSRGVQAPLAAFNAGKPVFMKLKVPPEAFVAAGAARVAFDFLISLVLLIPLFVYYQVTPAFTIVLLPVVMLATYLLATAVGMLLVPVGALYQDVRRASEMLLRFAMFFTPVVYTIPAGGVLRQVMLINPFSSILDCARGWMIHGSAEAWGIMLIVMVVSLIVLLLGMIVLRVVMPHLVARMGM